MLLNDKQIWELIRKQNMIYPAVNRLMNRDQRGKIISYGLSSAGYDIRVDNEFRFLTKNMSDRAYTVDPKDIDEEAFISKVADGYIYLPPRTFTLAKSVEYFRMPRNVMGLVQGKSTYARCGIITPVTPLEPGWEGNITLEIFNSGDHPAKIYVGEGICQVLFYGINNPVVSYADRSGKYQGQIGITLPKV